MTPFRHGLRGSEYPGKKFLNEYRPMPKTLLAFAVTVVSSILCSLSRIAVEMFQVENVLEEYVTGRRVNMQLTRAAYKDKYDLHYQTINAWASSSKEAWTTLSEKLGDSAA